ncbi:MAG: hypothetical protein J6W09_10205, partial [Bacteroidales bacterium]|nr:hypothetical protein [Bacteroidales bacterium]
MQKSTAATSPVKFRTTATGYRRIRLFKFRRIISFYSFFSDSTGFARAMRRQFSITTPSTIS